MDRTETLYRQKSAVGAKDDERQVQELEALLHTLAQRIRKVGGVLVGATRSSQPMRTVPLARSTAPKLYPSFFAAISMPMSNELAGCVDAGGFPTRRRSMRIRNEQASWQAGPRQISRSKSGRLASRRFSHEESTDIQYWTVKGFPCCFEGIFYRSPSISTF